MASRLRQQQGGDTQERGQSQEGALLLSEVSEPPCDPDTDSLCMWSPEQNHGHLPRGEQVGTGRVDPQCTGTSLHPGTWAPCSLGRGPTTQRGTLDLTGVGDFPQKDDALGVFENYGNQEGPVETHSGSQECSFHADSRGSSSFRALLVHIQRSTVDHLWGHQSSTHQRRSGWR